MYVLYHLLLELDDVGGVDLVDEPAEDDPVLEDLGIVALGQGLLQHSRDPLDQTDIVKLEGKKLMTKIIIIQWIDLNIKRCKKVFQTTRYYKISF